MAKKRYEQIKAKYRDQGADTAAIVSPSKAQDKSELAGPKNSPRKRQGQRLKIDTPSPSRGKDTSKKRIKGEIGAKVKNGPDLKDRDSDEELIKSDESGWD